MIFLSLEIALIRFELLCILSALFTPAFITLLPNLGLAPIRAVNNPTPENDCLGFKTVKKAIIGRRIVISSPKSEKKQFKINAAFG